ncbi:hypothetical protein GE21DRAFT_1135880 [Neurospora crassa]|nr:hypothetical protein GE21DRAFT_1135880 [Neurospora crassa]
MILSSLWCALGFECHCLRHSTLVEAVIPTSSQMSLARTWAPNMTGGCTHNVDVNNTHEQRGIATRLVMSSRRVYNVISHLSSDIPCSMCFVVIRIEQLAKIPHGCCIASSGSIGSQSQKYDQRQTHESLYPIKLPMCFLL